MPKITNITKSLQRSLASKLIFALGATLLLSISIWAYYNIEYQKQRSMRELVTGADRLSNTIKLGAHYAMMLNSRDDINQIINNIARQPEIETIRIYNKAGRIKFSNQAGEVDQVTNIRDEACFICHKTDPPLVEIDLRNRVRFFQSPEGGPMLGVISAIRNEPDCTNGGCHVHPVDKSILGALDVVVSIQEANREILRFEKGVITLAVTMFLVTAAIIFILVLKFVNQPIRRLIRGTLRIAEGDYQTRITRPFDDEIGQLAEAINHMRREIGQKQAQLNQQRDEYQALFEQVPCLITVQGRDYKLIKYNQQFAENFDPQPEDYCFRAYKGRTEKCVVCPVERTFEDGRVHVSEESGRNKYGKDFHWLVTTSPVRDENGEIVAAMEMSLDITRRKKLEEELEKSEKKYYAIFNNIPNPVFVLDPEDLRILDCNESVSPVYGYPKAEIIDRPFPDLFREKDRAEYAARIQDLSGIDKARQSRKDGRSIFVNIRISPSEYHGRRVLLVTTSDITKRLEAEQQLIQASKMATLGEMATGVAHELNQPLSVIKTASSFFMKKIKKNQPIGDEILLTMSEEIDSHVDRATKIINHMRQFGRKSDMALEPVRINDILTSAFDIFSQQLKVRGIEVAWEIEENLPRVMGDHSRLEQVFINLLINARDAIEEWENRPFPDRHEKKITLTSSSEEASVRIGIRDTGVGIPKEVVDRIFEPFFTTKKVGKGTGLGLSISYGIIQECGGTIEVLSRPEEGTCFTIDFPIPDEVHGE